MDSLLHIGLSNAIAACALAAVAGIVGCFCRRPAVRHALWLLVLLKLVTPPLIDIPVGQPPASPSLADASAPEEASVRVLEIDVAPVAVPDVVPVAVDDEQPDFVAVAPAQRDEPTEPILATSSPAGLSDQPEP